MNHKQYDSEEMARRWHALAERRREHFAELYNSGRWRKYYREQDFMAQMRATAYMVDAWDKVVRNEGVPIARVNGGARTNGLHPF
jgi:uncharacterized repeat protein (TIGR03809 family)